MKVIFKSPFLKSIKKIKNVQLKKNIAEAIENVENANDIRNINNFKKLKGYKDYYRIKIGDHRIGIKIIEETVYFVDIEHRKDIYKYFP